jgi:hypothetical protein
VPTNNNYDPRAGKSGSGMYGGSGRTSSGGFGSQSGGIGSTSFGSGGGFGSSGSMGSGANVGQGFGNIDQSHAGTFGTGGLMGTGFNTKTYEQGYDQFGNPQYGVVPGAAGTPGGSPYGGFGNSALGQNPYGGAGGLESMHVMGAGTSANPNYQPVGGTYGDVSYGQGGIYNDPAYQSSMMNGGYGYGPAGPQSGPGGGMATSTGYQWDQATGRYYGANATASGDMQATDRIGSDGQSLGGSHIPWWAIGNPSAEKYYSNRTQQLDGTYQVNPQQPQSAPQQPQSAQQQPQSAPQQQPQGFQPGPGYQPGTPYQPSYNPNGYYDPATQTDHTAGWGGGPAQQSQQSQQPSNPISKGTVGHRVPTTTYQQPFSGAMPVLKRGTAGGSTQRQTVNPFETYESSMMGGSPSQNPFETYEGPMMDGNPNLGSNLGGGQTPVQGQPWSGGGNFELGPGGLIPGTGNPAVDGGLYLRDGKITGSWGTEVQLSSLPPEIQAQLGPLMGNGQQTATGATGLKDAKGGGWGSGEDTLLPPGMGGNNQPQTVQQGGGLSANFSKMDPNAPQPTSEFLEYLQDLQRRAPGLPKYPTGPNRDLTEYRAASKARGDWLNAQEALFTGEKYQQGGSPNNIGGNPWGSPSQNPFETYEGPMMDGNPNLGSKLGGNPWDNISILGNRGPTSLPGHPGYEERMRREDQQRQDIYNQQQGGGDQFLVPGPDGRMVPGPGYGAATNTRPAEWGGKTFNPFGAVTRPPVTTIPPNTGW